MHVLHHRLTLILYTKCNELGQFANYISEISEIFVASDWGYRTGYSASFIGLRGPSSPRIAINNKKLTNIYLKIIAGYFKAILEADLLNFVLTVTIRISGMDQTMVVREPGFKEYVLTKRIPNAKWFIMK